MIYVEGLVVGNLVVQEVDHSAGHLAIQEVGLIADQDLILVESHVENQEVDHAVDFISGR
ncbi:hypothetical protein H9X78_14265 [Clostridium saudiense]|nr:hypothetical protein [Clostridium saudiense]MBM6861610.1 hypothetical protein [Clostridium saudiense]